MNWRFWSDNFVASNFHRMYNLIYERLARPVGRLVCHGQEMCKWSISLCDAMGVEIDSIFFVYIFLIEKGGYT